MDSEILFNYRDKKKCNSGLTVAKLTKSDERLAVYIDIYGEWAWLLLESNPVQVQELSEILGELKKKDLDPYGFEDIRPKSDVEIVELEEDNLEIKEMNKGQIFGTRKSSNPRKIGK